MKTPPTLDATQVILALQGAGYGFGYRGSRHFTMWNEVTRSHITVPLHELGTKRALLEEIIKRAGISRPQFIKLSSKRNWRKPLRSPRISRLPCAPSESSATRSL